MDDKNQAAFAFSEDKLKTIIREAVRAEFTACGLLASTPAEQIEAQSDFLFLRRGRRAYEDLVTKIGTAVVLITVTALCGLIALGFNLKFGK